MNEPPAGWLQGAAAVRVFACFALAYFASFALRTIGSIIAPELIGDFTLSNGQLGSLSSAYFLGFAALQLPLGIWLDRFGSRRTHATLLTIAALGCALFAVAGSFTALWIGRVLIGVGVAGGLMAALKAFRFWYAPRRQLQLAAWMLMSGSLGALATTVPVRTALPYLGWRGVFWVVCALLALAAVTIWSFLPRDEERSSQARITGEPLWTGYREVFADPYFRRFVVVSVLSQSGFISLQSLWAGPWLIDVLGLSPAQAAQVLFGFNLVLMAGYLSVGALIPRVNRLGWSMVRIVLVGTSLLVLIEIAIASTQSRWAWPLWLVLAITGTYFSTVQTHVSLSFPPALTGRAFTAYNLLTFSAIFASQWLFGVGVDAFKAAGLATPMAFRATLMALVGLQVLGLVWFHFSKAQPRGSLR